MAVDPISEALKIKPLITDDLYNAYLTADKDTQREFLNELGEDELLNMQLRLNNQFNVPDDEFEAAFSSARRDFMLGGDYPTDPTGMPMYNMPIEGSQAQDLAQEIFAGMREKGFDYSGLPNNKLRRGLSFMDTAGEKEDFLTKNVGPQGVGWTQDKYGRYAIMPEFREQLGGTPGDMPLTIDNPGTFERGDIADLAGSAPEITATILASIASRNLGLGPAILASGTAAGTAKGAEEGVETLLGLQQQTLGEVGKDVAAEAALGATAELGGRGLMSGGKLLFSPGEVRIPTGETTPFLGMNFKTYTYAPRVDAAQGPGVTETQTLVRELIDEGAIPEVEKATGRSLVGKVSGMIEQIFGYNKQKNVVNVKFMTDRMNKFLTDAGAEPFDPTVGKILKSLNEEELGALIQARIAKSKSSVETSVDQSLKTLKELVDTESKKVTGSIGTRVDDPGTVLNQQIFDAFDSFKTNINKLYNEADNLLGNKPIIPTEALKTQAREILETLPKKADGSYVGGVDPKAVGLLTDILEVPSHISSVQMSTYRTLFGDAAFSDEMLVGIGARNYNLLKSAANDSFEQAITNGLKGYSYVDRNGNLIASTRKMSARETERVKLGLTKLDEAKNIYAEGINVFDNRLIKLLTKKDGVDPARFINTVVKPNSPVSIKQFLNTVDNPDTAKAILQAGHWDDMVYKATNVEGDLSTSGLLSEIKRLGTSYPALYGEAAPIIKNTLQELNKVQKIIPREQATTIRTSLLESLEKGEFGSYKQVVKNYVDDVNKQFDFYDANFSKTIGKQSPEEVMPWLMNTAKSQDLTDFINYYQKSDPAIVEKFRQNFMQNILESAFVAPKGSPVGRSISGEKLLTTISDEKMIPRLNAVFGPDLTTSLLRFAEKAEFLTTKTGTMAGAFAANSIALNPLAHVSQLVKLRILGSVLANPTTLKYLTTIVESPIKRDVGFAVLNLGTDIIAQIAAEDSTVDPDQLEKMTLELQNGVLGLTDEAFNNYEDEEE